MCERLLQVDQRRNTMKFVSGKRWYLLSRQIIHSAEEDGWLEECVATIFGEIME